MFKTSPAICFLLCATALAAAPNDEPGDRTRRLQDLHELFAPAIKEEKASFHIEFHVSYLPLLRQSKWRGSVPEAVRLLIASDDPEDKSAGWALARESGFNEWTTDDVDRILKESDDDDRSTAVSTLAQTKSLLLGECIERILNSADSQTGSKETAIACLESVEDIPLRIRLWTAAAANPELRQSCISTFPSVSSSEPTVILMAKGLEDRSEGLVAISNHTGYSTEMRILTCKALARSASHRDAAAQEIERRCVDSPSADDLEFSVEAMIAIHRLTPKSSLPVTRLIRWFDDFPRSRCWLFRRLEFELQDDSAFEAMVIPKAPSFSPQEKVFLCRWLSRRRSGATLAALKALLKDSHPGVQTAAFLAIGRRDPLLDLSAVREAILQSGKPEDIALPFGDLSDALMALALAGNSVDEAKKWLESIQLPAFQEARLDASERITGYSNITLDILLDVPWVGANIHPADDEEQN